MRVGSGEHDGYGSKNDIEKYYEQPWGIPNGPLEKSGQVYGPMLKKIVQEIITPFSYMPMPNTREIHPETPQIRLTTPNVPKSTPTHPRTMAGNTPAGINGSGAPLNGTKLDDAAPLAAEPPVPPPVKLAPFGPIGRELSVNWHVLDVQMHCPATGSQKGVEQLEGKR